jgi:hypothetical protein
MLSRHARALTLRATFSLSLSISLAACGGGGASGGDGLPSSPAPTSRSAWSTQNPLPGSCCNYAQILLDSFENGAQARIYTNSDLATAAGILHLYQGDLSGVSDVGPVLSIANTRDAYIRTFGLARRDGKYFALLYTGDAYPSSGGYSPSWAHSDDGISWTWDGPVSPYPRALSSGQALTAEPDGSFKAWIDQVGGTLREMSSLDGIHWQDQGDIWPSTLPRAQALFPNAVRTEHGTMLSVADAFPATKIRTLWRCHGQSSWKLLEEDAPIRHGFKGSALAWDGQSIHAFANGSHWTRAEPACPAS